MAKKGPNLNLDELEKISGKENFQKLLDYFKNSNPLGDFTHLSYKCDVAQDHVKVAHGLGVKPHDIIKSTFTGVGKLTWHRDEFDDTFLVLSTTGAVKTRFLVGSKREIDGNLNFEEDDTEIWESTSAVADTNPIGMIVTWPTDTAPAGWLIVSEVPLRKADYPALYAALGDTFATGSEPAGYFSLPSTPGRAIIGVGDNTGLTGRLLGDQVGEQTHILTTPEMPSHNHTATTPINMFYNGPGGGAVANVFLRQDINTAFTVTIGSTGGGGAHNNMQPSIALNFIIKYQ